MAEEKEVSALQEQADQTVQQLTAEAQPQEPAFYYADKEDEAMGIETFVYPNSNMVKRLTLSTGKTAIVRELKGVDMTEVEKLTDGDQAKVFPAMIATAAKVDGSFILMEDVLQYKAKDYNRLKIATSALNF